MHIQKSSNFISSLYYIRFVRIFDRDLAEEYSLPGLPTLVYFRRQIPLVYTGDLTDEPEVLEWLILHQNSVEDEITVASVTSEELGIMVENVDNVLVLFHDKRRKSQKVSDPRLKSKDCTCSESNPLPYSEKIMVPTFSPDGSKLVSLVTAEYGCLQK